MKKSNSAIILFLLLIANWQIDANYYKHHPYTAKPHFYSTDSMVLNARGMELKEVALLSSNGKHIPLNYDYDSLLLKIHLDHSYTKDESLTLFIIMNSYIIFFKFFI